MTPEKRTNNELAQSDFAVIVKLAERTAERVTAFYAKAVNDQIPVSDDYMDIQVGFSETCRDFQELTALLRWHKGESGRYLQGCHDRLLNEARQLDEIIEKKIRFDGLWISFYAGLLAFGQELRRIAKMSKKGELPVQGADDAYIPFTKAIEFGRGILTRKKLERAIKQGKPVEVRFKKPSTNRLNVHIQDFILLINKLSENDKGAEEAARMFGEYKEQHQRKMAKGVNLD